MPTRIAETSELSRRPSSASPQSHYEELVDKTRNKAVTQRRKKRNIISFDKGTRIETKNAIKTILNEKAKNGMDIYKYKFVVNDAMKATMKSPKATKFLSAEKPH